ncbi:hypothetical protein, partial [Brevundimonas sp.]|uniref:hypothetical protein n=1 Tax=Brevundimonas sp. TaxID=1871086 RepID=UPI00272C0842
MGKRRACITLKISGRRIVLNRDLSHGGAGEEDPTADSRLSSERFRLEDHGRDLSLSDSLEALAKHAERIHP